VAGEEGGAEADHAAEVAADDKAAAKEQENIKKTMTKKKSLSLSLSVLELGCPPFFLSSRLLSPPPRSPIVRCDLDLASLSRQKKPKNPNIMHANIYN